MDDTIHSIKYVFEARLDSVQTFVGDEAGNKIAAANANWKNGLGYFEDKNGTSLKVYSKVWITVCKSYKGKLPTNMVILGGLKVLCSSSGRSSSGLKSGSARVRIRKFSKSARPDKRKLKTDL